MNPVNRPSKKTVQNWLRIGQLRAEKCDLAEATEAYQTALQAAKRLGDLKTTMEALSGLLRLAGEALDEPAIQRSERELDQLMAAHPRRIPPMAWYCKGVIAGQREQWKMAQRYFHRYLRAVRAEGSRLSAESVNEADARAWSSIATALRHRGHYRRAQWLVEEVLRRYEKFKFRGVNGVAYLILGNLAERERDFPTALKWYQNAHASFLAEHNWYLHLYVLYGYARIARIEQNYPQAYWYLDLMDKATASPEFGVLRREVARERSRLEQDAVDILIDSRRGIVKTQRGGQISLRKQYVLLSILEALSDAHSRPGSDSGRGLSKAEIIENVWHEAYRPEAHDNKLYYNINRLRKLIEPDIRQPQYLLNWKQGYRLAPGLRVHCIGNRSGNRNGSEEGNS